MSGWIMTRSGKPFYPARPSPSDIDILDIAHALSMTCRYGGHSRRFYSVAEHCVLVAAQVPAKLRLAALLHDAAEAYIGDIPRPLKHGLGAWHAAERAIEEAVALRFGTPPPMPPDIKDIDDRIILDEWAVLMPSTEADIGVSGTPVGVTIRCWTPDVAKAMFLGAFSLYGGWS